MSEEWPKSEFEGMKVVLLYENGSIVYTWLGMDIKDVLSSPTPPELIARKRLSEESLKEWIGLYPEITESFVNALDHGISDGRLLEATIQTQEYNLDEWLSTKEDD
jgi:hypothetical protein